MIKKGILVLALFLLIGKTALASETSYIDVTRYYDPTSGLWTNPANGYTVDGNVAQHTSTQFNGIYYFLPGFSTLPGITPQRVIFHVKASSSASRSHVIKIAKGNNGIGAGQNITLSNSLNFVDITFNLSDYPSISLSDLQSNQIGLFIEHPGFPSSTTSIDSVSAKLVFEGGNPIATISNLVASPSAQLITMNLSGDTATVSATMRCDIQFIPKCGDGQHYLTNGVNMGANVTVQGNISNVASQSQVPSLYSKYMYGYDWNMTTGDSTWKADQVTMDYLPGTNCKLDYITSCTDLVNECHMDGEFNVCTSGPKEIYKTTSTIDLTNTPGLGQTVEEPAPSDPIQWLAWKIKGIVTDVFSITFQVDWETKKNLEDKIKTKAPFSYIQKVLNVRLASRIDKTTYSINFPTPPGFNSYGLTASSIEVVAPTWLVDQATVIRNLISAILYVLLLFYFVMLARRVMNKGE